MNKILKTLQQCIILLFRIPYYKIWKLYDPRANDVIIVFPDFPRDILLYFYSDAFINDVALVKSFTQQGKKFRIVVNFKKALDLKDKTIYYNLGNRYRIDRKENYSKALISFVSELSKNNVCHPSFDEVKWWENKAYMHTRFKELGIKEPHSKIIDTDKISLEGYKEFAFPFLIKEIHSAGSLGVHKINNHEDVKRVVDKIKTEKLNDQIIFQKLLKMDRDLRVIVVGREIVLYYWRINKNKEWKPTSTTHGSDVDFDFFPEMWREHIINLLQKTGLRTGAFDLVWENNDYSMMPFVLEVSPSYQPNPKPPKLINQTYGQWKKGFNLINGYPSKFIDIVFGIKSKLIKTYTSSKVYF